MLSGGDIEVFCLQCNFNYSDANLHVSPQKYVLYSRWDLFVSDLFLAKLLAWLQYIFFKPQIIIHEGKASG